jgi:DNA repair photolyase
LERENQSKKRQLKPFFNNKIDALKRTNRMNWDKIKITKQDGEVVDSQAPIIISASRATDIPAFYADWFVERIKAGYVKWKNPFNGVPLFVTFKNARLIVFWSKNPKPIIKNLDFIQEHIPNFYFQYTLNDYDADKLELKVPSLQFRIDTFVELSDKIGHDKVIWRFDPLILTDKIGVDELLRKTENIGNQLKDYTDKMVFSFADIQHYKKVQTNLQKSQINYREFDDKTMNEYAAGLQQLNKSWGFEIGTCAEKIQLENYGIVHNKCVDDDLMIKLFPHDKILMDFLGVTIKQPELFGDIPNEAILLKNGTYALKTKNNKDKGQREFCGCIMSKDIGEYNTCPHLCEYCYANASKELALANWKKHKSNTNNEMIKGE